MEPPARKRLKLDAAGQAGRLVAVHERHRVVPDWMAYARRARLELNVCGAYRLCCAVCVCVCCAVCVCVCAKSRQAEARDSNSWLCPSERRQRSLPVVAGSRRQLDAEAVVTNMKPRAMPAIPEAVAHGDEVVTARRGGG